MPALRPIRILLADDSAVVRLSMRRLLEAEPDFVVVGAVENGLRAVEETQRLRPDVLILDIEMPVMGGLEAMGRLAAARSGAAVIVSSTLTRRNAEISMRALELGAADCMAKPGAMGGETDPDSYAQAIKARIRDLVSRQRTGKPQAADIEARRWPPVGAARPQVVVIGASTGGPQALLTLLPEIATVPVPILVTQHMPPMFTTVLAEHIARACKMPCGEARDQAAVTPGIHIAPGGHHMLVVAANGHIRFAVTQDPPENYCRPAVDPMLRSAVGVYGARTLAVILTGMGSDGLQGCRQIAAAGGTVIAQDEASSAVWGMPRAVAAAGLCSAVLPLPRLGAAVRALFS